MLYINFKPLTTFSRKLGSKDKKKRVRVASPKKLLINKPKQVKYKGDLFDIAKPSKATQKNKKYQVLVINKTTGRKKTVSWGRQGYEDFLTHKDEGRRDRFQKRFSGIKLKDGSRAADNPMQSAFYATKYNW